VSLFCSCSSPLPPDEHALDAYHLRNLIVTDLRSLYSDHPPSKNFQLASKFLRGKNLGPILGAELYYAYSESTTKNKIRGNVLETLAQLSFRTIPTLLLQPAFEFLVDIGKDIFDSTQTLWLLLSISDGTKKFSTRILKPLLDAGADVNDSRCQVTLLQLGVLGAHRSGVDLLLEAGADPNALGNGDVNIWYPDIAFKRFNDIGNKSALLLCEEKLEKEIHTDFSSIVDELYYIREFLLQRGAKSFWRYDKSQQAQIRQ
jgi:hypothetical protein